MLGDHTNLGGYGWLLDERVAPDAKLRQGDLIKFDLTDDPLRAAGIVVTADCDLEQKKHARLVTLIPIISVKSVLECYLLLEDCEKKREEIERLLIKQFSISSEHDRSTRYEMLNKALTSAEETICQVIQMAAKFVLGALDHIPVATYHDLMKRIGSSVKKTESLSQQIKSRGDLLSLPDTTSFGLDVEVAWIRHIWQVPLSSIALRTSEVKGKVGERIARLDSPFRYRLTQQMGQVFSDIGLPTWPSALERSVESAINHV